MAHLSACGVSAVINTKLYVTTACDGFSGYRRDLDVYDPANDSWTSLSESHVAHSQPAGAEIDGKLYVAGGQNTRGLTSITEVYDPATNSWTSLARMHTAVVNPASVGFGGKLWVFGGSDGTNVQSLVQVYDPITDRWRTSTLSMPAPSQQAGAAVTYGIAFVAGGSTGSALVGTNNALFVFPSIP